MQEDPVRNSMRRIRELNRGSWLKNRLVNEILTGVASLENKVLQQIESSHTESKVVHPGHHLALMRLIEKIEKVVVL